MNSDLGDRFDQLDSVRFGRLQLARDLDFQVSSDGLVDQATVTEAFDPYHIWLGIPPDEQPPHHYRLLGIGLFESDPDVISNAADRQMTHVRTFQTGPHSAQSQKLLNELAAARVTLLDPARRATYDAELRRQLERQSAPWTDAAPVAPALPVEPSPADDADLEPVLVDHRPVPLNDQSWTARLHRARRQRWAWQGTLALALLPVALVAVLAWLLLPLATHRPIAPAVTPSVDLPKPAQPSAAAPNHATRQTPRPLPAATNPQPEQNRALWGPQLRSQEARTSIPAPNPTTSQSPDIPPATIPDVPVPAPTIPATTSPVPSAATSRSLDKPQPKPDQPGSPKLDIEALKKIKGFDCRHEPARSLLLAALGGTEASQTAVDRAVNWIASHQLPDGSWNFDHAGHGEGVGNLNAPRTATALAILALVGAGQGQRTAEHRLCVFRGAQYLVRQMKAASPPGSLFENTRSELPSHAIATVALCEVGADARNKAFLDAARSAVQLIAVTQNPDGGWALALPSSPKAERRPSDIFVTGWTITALSTARVAHLEIPNATLERAGVFLDSLRSPDRSGYGRFPSHPADSEATPVGFLARIYLGWQVDKPELRRYADRLGELGPRRDGNLAFDYHATLLARYHAGSAWNAWNPAMRDFLVSQQVATGPDSGTWYFPNGNDLAHQGGRLYSTAMAALILESYYRYPPPPALLESR